MKITELIEKLKTYPQETRVLLSGYEGGLKELNYVDHIGIQLNVNDKWYYGSHERVDEGEDEMAIHLY